MSCNIRGEGIGAFPGIVKSGDKLGLVSPNGPSVGLDLVEGHCELS